MQEQNTEFSAFAVQWKPRIDASLERSTAQLLPGLLPEAMRYSLLLPGKRLRPLLTLAACEACGGDPSDAIGAANAVEMVHCFSLIHDDLPAMDNDELRRGKPTNHKVFGEAQAILAGDALLAIALRVVSEYNDSRGLVCCRELSTAAYLMTEGQSIDVQGFEKTPSREDLEDLHGKKTGRLILCALRIGGVIAGASLEKMTALSEYGRRLGLAFQITDDLIDHAAERGKATFPSVLGVEESRAFAQRLIREACDLLQPAFGEKSSVLRSLAESMLDRDR